ncbi:hypothetical protein COU74_04560 [Candidatus Peregrinibacteria bacterium CG10_big_fil_rev_8_21_14_0_10_36_19]|nr:MAG: hypothetical protein COU74_04560 [Candidatus Peregrinibacteria bacterium CG10_big_fil_rev_8_21_14_0_10_36_19]
MDFKAANEYLSGLVSYEKRRDFKIEDLNLENVKKVLDDFCDGWKGIKYVHVAGSKGKGSVSHLISDYLVRSGRKTGLFTSPHVVSICERLRVNGADVTEARFCELVDLLKERGGKELTYFEALFVLAIKLFLLEGVEFAVLEVGLGGRLDTTNVVTPVVSVLSTVELEHTDILGDTLEKILNEKMGIKKDGVPMVIGYQDQEVYRFLEGRDGLIFAEKKCGKCGDFREGNYNVAILALEALLGSVDVVVFSDVIENFQLLGRFDIREIDGKWVVFDVAHTMNSISALIKQLRFYFSDFDPVFLVSLMKDKNVDGILEKLSSVGEVNFVDCGEERAVFADEDCFSGYERLFGSLKKDQVLVVTGSFYLVGKILRAYYK